MFTKEQMIEEICERLESIGVIRSRREAEGRYSKKRGGGALWKLDTNERMLRQALSDTINDVPANMIILPNQRHHDEGCRFTARLDVGGYAYVPTGVGWVYYREKIGEHHILLKTYGPYANLRLLVDDMARPIPRKVSGSKLFCETLIDMRTYVPEKKMWANCGHAASEFMNSKDHGGQCEQCKNYKPTYLIPCLWTGADGKRAVAENYIEGEVEEVMVGKGSDRIDINDTDSLAKSRLEAKNNGDRLYYTGELCHNGHDSPRMTRDASCVLCSRENSRHFYRHNKERLKKRKERGYVLDSGEVDTTLEYRKYDEQDTEGLPSTASEAKALGLPIYFTNKPCIRGHVVVRRAKSGRCLECERQKSKECYYRDKEARNALLAAKKK